jgi:hypothetical protein
MILVKIIIFYPIAEGAGGKLEQTYKVNMEGGITAKHYGLKDIPARRAYE